MKFRKVAVLGGYGNMGSDIVRTIAQAGLEVLLYEDNLELAQMGKSKLDKTFQKLIKKGKISAQVKQNMLNRITVCDNYEAMFDVDLVIEAVFDNAQLTGDIFKKLDGIVKYETLLASDTWSQSLTEIASATNRPDKVIGIHFINPVPFMKRVELEEGWATSEDTYQASVDFCEQIGKKVRHGWRKCVLSPYLNRNSHSSSCLNHKVIVSTNIPECALG